MENELEKYDLFLQYVRKELSSEEVKAFERQLTEDKDFAQSFEEFELSNDILMTHELMEVQDILNSFDYKSTIQPNTPNKWLFIGLGGIVFLMIGVIVFVNKKPKQSTKHEIISKRTTQIIDSPIQVEPSITEKKTEEKIDSTPQKVVIIPAKKESIIEKKEKEILPTIQKTVIDSLKKSPIKEPISVKKDSVKTEKTVLKTPIIQEKTSQKTPKIAEKEPIIVKTFPDIYYIIPSQNIEWEIPFDEGKILIMNKSGQLVHEIILEKGAENRWNGMTTQGFVPAGLYVFYVENGNPTNPLKGKISVQP